MLSSLHKLITSSLLLMCSISFSYDAHESWVKACEQASDGKYRESIKLLSSAIEQVRKDNGMNGFFSKLWNRKSDGSKCFPASDLPFLLADRGICRERLGLTLHAASDYRDAQRLSSTSSRINAFCASREASCLLRMFQYDEAFECLKNICRNSPCIPTVFASEDFIVMMPTSPLFAYSDYEEKLFTDRLEGISPLGHTKLFSTSGMVCARLNDTTPRVMSWKNWITSEAPFCCKLIKVKSSCQWFRFWIDAIEAYSKRDIGVVIYSLQQSAEHLLRLINSHEGDKSHHLMVAYSAVATDLWTAHQRISQHSEAIKIEKKVLEVLSRIPSEYMPQFPRHCILQQQAFLNTKSTRAGDTVLKNMLEGTKELNLYAPKFSVILGVTCISSASTDMIEFIMNNIRANVYGAHSLVCLSPSGLIVPKHTDNFIHRAIARDCQEVGNGNRTSTTYITQSIDHILSSKVGLDAVGCCIDV